VIPVLFSLSALVVNVCSRLPDNPLDLAMTLISFSSQIPRFGMIGDSSHPLMQHITDSGRQVI
jgi:hypothetical protein